MSGILYHVHLQTSGSGHLQQPDTSYRLSPMASFKPFLYYILTDPGFFYTSNQIPLIGYPLFSNGSVSILIKWICFNLKYIISMGLFQPESKYSYIHTMNSMGLFQPDQQIYQTPGLFQPNHTNNSNNIHQVCFNLITNNSKFQLKKQ